MNLEYSESYYPQDRLTLRELSYKLVVLLALLPGQRLRVPHSFSLSSFKMSYSRLVFSVDVTLKLTWRGKLPENNKLCIVPILKEYSCRTKGIRGNESEHLISYQKTHKHVCKDKRARWLRDVLSRASVDTQQFAVHSTRAASTSAAMHHL